MPANRLVLFDIDGTILLGGQLWKESFLGALAHCFPTLEFPSIAFSGKTDIQIVREMLALAGFSEDDVEQKTRLIIDQYIDRASAAASLRPHEVTVLPGVREILDQLSNHPSVVLGLLTGNVRKGAYVKLGCAGLDHHFDFGVFGDDHWDRYQLPALAVARAQDRLGVRFSGKQVVIIGDTVHDVNCGKSIGVRTIAVGTGRGVSLEELLAQNPDYYFKDLSDTFSVVQAILEDLDSRR